MFCGAEVGVVEIVFDRETCVRPIEILSVCAGADGCLVAPADYKFAVA